MRARSYDFDRERETAPPGVAAGAASTAVAACSRVLSDLFGPPDARSFAVRYWDGQVEGPRADARFTLVLTHPGSLRAMLLPPSELTLAEAYLSGAFEVEGDLEAGFQLRDQLQNSVRSPRSWARLVSRALRLPRGSIPAVDSPHRPAPHRLASFGRRHSRERDAAAVRSHYDVGNDFYALWLDGEMVYSCAYFPRGTETLDQAQMAKFEHICRKLRLQPGESLLDIGCGWGGLIRYAAERFGVRATGITLSEPQAAVARQRIGEAGLADRVAVEVCDYRDLPPAYQFDKVVSVGMLEHVGRSRMREYFGIARRLVRPGGLFLAHGIVSIQPTGMGPLTDRLWRRIWGEGTFIQRYVFPDGELLSAAELAASAEAAGWEPRDLENLREHYARTLRLWVRNLEMNQERAIAMVGDRIYRTWRLYMAGCAYAFSSALVGVVQLLLSATRDDGTCELPPTRADIYLPAT